MKNAENPVPVHPPETSPEKPLQCEHVTCLDKPAKVISFECDDHKETHTLSLCFQHANNFTDWWDTISEEDTALKKVLKVESIQ